MTRPELVKELNKKRMKRFSGIIVAQLRDMLKKEVRSQMTLGGKGEMRKVGSKVGRDGARWGGGQDSQGKVGNMNSGTDIMEEDVGVAGDSGEEAGGVEGGTAACGDSDGTKSLVPRGSAPPPTPPRPPKDPVTASIT